MSGTDRSFRIFKTEWIIPDEEKMDINDAFVLCKASELGLYDKFMNYEPSTVREKKFKQLLKEVIKSGLKDFFRPICDPSFDRYYRIDVEHYSNKIKERKICYAKGEEPARGEVYNWWKEKALCFCPERQSRLGTRKEYIAFLGTLIKKLVEIGWRINDAWDAVCNFCGVGDEYDTFGKRLKYIKTENGKYIVDLTVSREISVFFDLMRTAKIFAWDEAEQGFWISGVKWNVYTTSEIIGFYNSNLDNNHYNFAWRSYNIYENDNFWFWYTAKHYSYKFLYHSLIDFGLYTANYCNNWKFNNIVGWIVLEK